MMSSPTQLPVSPFDRWCEMNLTLIFPGPDETLTIDVIGLTFG